MTVRPIVQRGEPILEKQTDAQIINPNEQIQQNISKIPQQKKWSTFLQKPKNVKPLCKKHEDERKLLGKPYKVTIIKQPKRDPKAKKVVHFQPKVTELENQTQTLLKESSDVTEIVEKTEDENIELEIQTAVKVTEGLEITEEDAESDNFSADEEIEEILKRYDDDDEYYPNKEELKEEQIKDTNKTCEKVSFKLPKPILKVKPITIENLPDTTMSLEEQLAAVQKQLLALAQLPSAIQSTLEAVTQQLNEIVNLKNSSESSNEENVDEETEFRSDESQLHEDENNNSISENAECDITENDADDQQLEELPSESLCISENHPIQAQENSKEEIREATPPPPELTEEEKEAIKREEEMIAKKQKEMEERKKRDWAERPIVLPGGRKWNGPDDTVPKFRNPKMSDDKIDQMIEPFSEVIVGKTKGINFLKYQPPPKNLAYLQNSEVYRLIHGMEPPIKGVGFRTEKVLSEKDYIGDQSVP